MNEPHELPPLTEQTTIDLAKIAHIQLSPNEVTSYTKDLDAVLHYMHQILEISTESIEPMYIPFERSMPLREDIVHACSESFIHLASEQEQNYYLGPVALQIE